MVKEAVARIRERNKFASDIAYVDHLPPDLRRCVHDFGFAPVHALIELGLTRGSQIRHAVRAISLGAREAANRPVRSGGNSRIEQLIDAVLLHHGAPALGREIVTALRHIGVTVIPVGQLEVGVEASMAALDQCGWVTKPQKHSIRLGAALRATDEAMWGPRP